MKKSIFIIIFLSLFGYFVYNNFFKKNTINIGFIAGLSGKYSSLGHNVLDGFNLAFDSINYQINGDEIKIMIKDDMQDEKTVKEHIDFFKKEKINLIVGNTTSSMTKISLAEISNSENIYLFSPSASSSEFSNIDDNFFRVQVAHSKERFNLLSKYLKENSLENLYIIYDTKNKSYTNNYLHNLKESIISYGGNEFIGEETIDKDFKKIIEQIKNVKNLDAIIIVANSIDTSKLIQFLKLNNINKQIIASGWAKNKKFLEDGGKAVEGTIFLTSNDMDELNKEYLAFVNKFKEKYNYEPSVFAAQGYETGKIIIEILKKDLNLLNFKKNLLEQKVFQGLQGNITFNKYGDVKRENFIVKVINNKFEKIDFNLE
jgi:branched-chain amino acid transport system substrate-binding protein